MRRGDNDDDYDDHDDIHWTPPEEDPLLRIMRMVEEEEQAQGTAMLPKTSSSASEEDDDDDEDNDSSNIGDDDDDDKSLGQLDPLTIISKLREPRQQQYGEDDEDSENDTVEDGPHDPLARRSEKVDDDDDDDDDDPGEGASDIIARIVAMKMAAAAAAAAGTGDDDDNNSRNSRPEDPLQRIRMMMEDEDEGEGEDEGGDEDEPVDIDLTKTLSGRSMQYLNTPEHAAGVEDDEDEDAIIRKKDFRELGSMIHGDELQELEQRATSLAESVKTKLTNRALVGTQLSTDSSPEASRTIGLGYLALASGRYKSGKERFRVSTDSDRDNDGSSPVDHAVDDPRNISDWMAVGGVAGALAEWSDSQSTSSNNGSGASWLQEATSSFTDAS